MQAGLPTVRMMRSPPSAPMGAAIARSPLNPAFSFVTRNFLFANRTASTHSAIRLAACLHHSALVAQFLKQADDLAPVSQRMGISPAVAAVGFFDGMDTEFAADLVEDEAFEPVNGIHNDGLELVIFVPNWNS